MTINEIVTALENNYTQVDIFDFMQEWITWSISDHDVYSNCTVQNPSHSLSIQALVRVPSPEAEDQSLDNMSIDAICINYTEDTGNKVQCAYVNKEEDGNKLIYVNLLDLDVDMGWVL